MSEKSTAKLASHDTPYTPESYNNEVLMAERCRRNEMTKPDTERLSRRIGKGALLAALYVGSAFVSDVSEGIVQGKERVRNDHAQIHHIYQADELPPELQEHATFVLTGLGTKDPSETAESLQSHKNMGNVYAIEYSNNNLDTQDIATRVVEQANKDDIEKISFDGYSAGGPIALSIAAHIHENEPDLMVTSVTLNSSPVGHNGLTERSEMSIEVMNRLLSLHDDLVYYEKGRIAIEVLARSEHYIEETILPHPTLPAIDGPNSVLAGTTRYALNYDELLKQIRSVRQKMNDPNAAAANLVKQQADFITTTDYDDNIRRLSTTHEDATSPPLITYTRSRLPENDTVVDVVASEQNLLRSLRQHGNRHSTLRADIGHANPTERPDEYAAIIQEKIQPKLAQSLNIDTAPKTPEQSLVDYLEVYAALNQTAINDHPPR